MALGAEVVDLVGLELVDQLDQTARLREVAVVEEEPHVLLVRVAVEVVDPVGVEAGRAADEAVHLVAAIEQLLGEVGAVLPGDAGDEGAGHERRMLPALSRVAGAHPVHARGPRSSSYLLPRAVLCASARS